VLSGGSVQCWGFDDNGELGNGTTTTGTDCNCIPTPVQVSSITSATAVAPGSSHTCAIRYGGSVQCWGFNLYARDSKLCEILVGWKPDLGAKGAHQAELIEPRMFGQLIVCASCRKERARRALDHGQQSSNAPSYTTAMAKFSE